MKLRYRLFTLKNGDQAVTQDVEGHLEVAVRTTSSPIASVETVTEEEYKQHIHKKPKSANIS